MPSKRSQDVLELIRAHKKMASDIGNGWLMKVDAPAEAVARLRVSGTAGAVAAGLDMPAVTVTP